MKLKYEIKFNASFLDFLINSLFLFFILAILAGSSVIKINSSNPKSPSSEHVLSLPILEIKNSQILLKNSKGKLIKQLTCKNISEILPFLKEKGTVLIKPEGNIPATCLSNVIRKLASLQISIYW